MTGINQRIDLLRTRLYDSYTTTHAGFGDEAAAGLIYRRDIRPALPNDPRARVVDIGCGQGHLVRLLAADGYDAEGIDISREQVAVANASGLDRVRLGDYRELLGGFTEQLDAVVATDLLEHLAKDEVLDTFDVVRRALRPGGVFVARVPNAVSPFGGRIQHGDFTHESAFTPRSVAQLSAAAAFDDIAILPCPPAAHGVKSAARVVVWKPISGFFKLALAAETGQLAGHIVTQNMTFVAHSPADSPPAARSVIPS